MPGQMQRSEQAHGTGQASSVQQVSGARQVPGAQQVHWGHVALAALVVLLVMVASAGASWVALGGWVGALAVFAGWCLMLVRARIPERAAVPYARGRGSRVGR